MEPENIPTPISATAGAASRLVVRSAGALTEARTMTAGRVRAARERA
jgi:hypothetical protein